MSAPEEGELLSFRARDGFPLRARRVAPMTGEARLKVLLAPATGVLSRFYLPFARYLADGGIEVLLPDLRGIGLSRPEGLRGRRFAAFDAGFGAWARLDLSAAFSFLEATGPRTPVAWVGHSLGGQVFPLVAPAERAAAVLFVAAQVGWVGHWRRLPTLRRYVGLMAALGAATTALGYGPGRVFGGEDLPRRAAADWAAWGLHPRYLAGWHRDARARAAAYRGPLASFAFTDDLDFAPPNAVRALLAWYERARIDARFIAPSDVGLDAIGHFGFFRRAAADTRLWHDARAWLLGATATPA